MNRLLQDQKIIRLEFGNQKHIEFARLMGRILTLQEVETHTCDCDFCESSDRLICQECGDEIGYSDEPSCCGQEYYTAQDKFKAQILYMELFGTDKKFYEFLQDCKVYTSNSQILTPPNE